MKIAIFGGGHGVCAAARLSDADHEARLWHRWHRWRRDAAAPAPAVRAGTFTSATLKDAEPGAIAAPATAWHAIARAMAPRRIGGQVAPSYSCRRTSGRTGPSLRAAAQRDNGRTMTAATLLLRVAQARQLNPLIRMLRLCAEDGGALPGFAAGAHIRVQVSLPDGKTDWRHYSLIDFATTHNATSAPDQYL